MNLGIVKLLKIKCLDEISLVYTDLFTFNITVIILVIYASKAVTLRNAKRKKCPRFV